MYWGGGWGNHAPETARTVAKAFYEGRKCKRGNCETDGEIYWLEGSAIARRIKPEDIPAYIALALEAQCPVRRLLEYSWAGYPTKMTARHLRALGLDAHCQGIKNPVVSFNSVPVDSSTWYTPAMIAALKRLPPVVKPPRRDVKFVNLTAELFPA